ncbi:MAG: class I SAM-dependent methyltransferase [Roseinatronobacter sp.]
MVPVSVPFADPAPRDARLTLAFAEGLSLPAGAITVLRPRAGESFAPLDSAGLTLVQSFRPDHDALQQAGYTVVADFIAAPVTLVCLPRSKAEALDLIAQAAGSDLVLVDGQKTDGIDSVLKAVRARADILGVVSKAHGKLFWFSPKGADLSERRATPQMVKGPSGTRFVTLPGVFSSDGVDPASALLAAHLPDDLPAQIADLGAGWGVLAAAVLSRRGPEVVHLVEAEAQALALARQNVTDPRAQFHWADATSFTLPGAVGGVVMNPPFHTGRSAQPALGLAFIATAARMLGTRGHLWMVGNRHLPYDAALSETFVEVTILTETPSFKVWHARTPRRGKAGAPRQRR